MDIMGRLVPLILEHLVLSWFTHQLSRLDGEALGPHDVESHNVVWPQRPGRRSCLVPLVFDNFPANKEFENTTPIRGVKTFIEVQKSAGINEQLKSVFLSSKKDTNKHDSSKNMIEDLSYSENGLNNWF